MKALSVCTAIALAFCLLTATAAAAQRPDYDDSEAESCATCHVTVQTFVVNRWLESHHADTHGERPGNTYCAKCHAPFQADASATHSDNDSVPVEEWENVTCSACHPPYALRHDWGTPIGTYDVATETWSPVYEEEADDLCEHCHTGSRHGKDWGGFGRQMSEHKGVRCIDCHMAKVENENDPSILTHAHDMGVLDNLPWSCGTVEGGCHSQHTPDWAEKQILKDKIHGKDNQGQTK